MSQKSLVFGKIKHCRSKGWLLNLAVGTQYNVFEWAWAYGRVLEVCKQNLRSVFILDYERV